MQHPSPSHSTSPNVSALDGGPDVNAHWTTRGVPFAFLGGAWPLSLSSCKRDHRGACCHWSRFAFMHARMHACSTLTSHPLFTFTFTSRTQWQ